MKKKKDGVKSFFNAHINKINYYIYPIFKTTIFLFLIGVIIHITFSWNFEKSDKIFHFLEASLWPIIAILFIFLFKNEISAMLIKGFQIIFPSGHEIRTGDTIPKQEERQKDPLPKNIESYEEVRKKTEEKIEKGQDIEKLKKDLINAQIYLDFERIYRIIFGSQIDLLKRLRPIFPSGEFSKDVILFFVFTQRLFPVFTSWSFDQYLTFLFNVGLISFSSDQYLITEKGKAFLAYIEFLNYPKKDL